MIQQSGLMLIGKALVRVTINEMPPMRLRLVVCHCGIFDSIESMLLDIQGKCLNSNFDLRHMMQTSPV